MLVYGDAQFAERLQPLRRNLGRLVEQASGGPHSLDTLRHLLIVCGQVEQAAHDGLVKHLSTSEARPFTGQFHAATAHAAEAFYVLACHQIIPLPPPPIDLHSALQALRHTLEDLDDAPDIPVTVKLPEGFSFHALYPEQYLLAAGKWHAEHGGSPGQVVTVVGIRSIGTTLAAVVSTALRAGGWDVHSFTVRPAGHPFARTVDLGGMPVQPDSFALIVDEGPGISGSSMAATAEALVAEGIPRDGIAFLPGHGNGPGGAGASEVQFWWQTAPCYVAQLDDLVFDGQALSDALTTILPEPTVQRLDFSGGLWRKYLYAEASAWPVLCTAFERVKYRYALSSGRFVLLKFLGLAAFSPNLASTAAVAAGLLAERSTRSLGPAAIGALHGFVATEWVEGVPLTAGELCGNWTAVDIGTYVAQVAGPPLGDEELQSATARLNEMARVNTAEALGPEAVERLSKLDWTVVSEMPCYGDGHLQRHEWIRGSDGGLVKVDGVGHDCDHTLVGKQPVAWDAAAAVVEWQLDASAAERLLTAIRVAGGTEITPDVLHFYRTAYLAFRAGQCSLSAQVHDPYERDRLLDAYARYREQLAACIGYRC